MDETLLLYTILSVGILQAGALIFWCGKVSQNLHDHNRRICRIEEFINHTRAEVTPHD